MPASGHALVAKYGFEGAPGILLGAAYLASITAGLYGFVFVPPTSVHMIVGFTVVALLWNFVFVLAGGIGLVARYFRAPRTEIIAVEMLSTIMLLWGVMTFLGPQSDQAGLGLLTISLLLYGWAAGTRAYLDKKETEYRAVRRK